MDFSEYKDFRLLINTEYGRFYKKYPYATLVLGQNFEKYPP